MNADLKFFENRGFFNLIENWNFVIFIENYACNVKFSQEYATKFLKYSWDVREKQPNIIWKCVANLRFINRYVSIGNIYVTGNWQLANIQT